MIYPNRVPGMTQNSAPTPYRSGNVPDLAFGRGGGGLEQLGHGLMGVARAAGQVAEEDDRARVMEAHNALSDWSRQRLFGEDGGYLHSAGRDAVTGAETVSAEFDAKLADMLEGLGNNRQKSQFAAIAGQSRQQSLDRVASHAAQQRTAWWSQTSEAAIVAAGQEAALTPEDPRIFGEGLKRVEHETRAIAERGNLDEAATERMVNQNVAAFIENVSESALSKDPKLALKIFERNRNAFTPEQAEAIGGRLYAGWAKAQAAEYVEAADLDGLRGFRKDVSSGVAERVVAEAQKQGIDPVLALTIRKAAPDAVLPVENQTPPDRSAPARQAVGNEAAKGGTPPDQVDPAQKAQDDVALIVKNAEGLKIALGREPQPFEIYLAQRQGLDGATLLLNGDKDEMVAMDGADAISAGSFIELCKNEFNEIFIESDVTLLGMSPKEREQAVAIAGGELNKAKAEFAAVRSEIAPQLETFADDLRFGRAVDREKLESLTRAALKIGATDLTAKVEEGRRINADMAVFKGQSLDEMALRIAAVEQAGVTDKGLFDAQKQTYETLRALSQSDPLAAAMEQGIIQTAKIGTKSSAEEWTARLHAIPAVEQAYGNKGSVLRKEEKEAFKKEYGSMDAVAKAKMMSEINKASAERSGAYRSIMDELAPVLPEFSTAMYLVKDDPKTAAMILKGQDALEAYPFLRDAKAAWRQQLDMQLPPYVTKYVKETAWERAESSMWAYYAGHAIQGKVGGGDAKDYGDHIRRGWLDELINADHVRPGLIQEGIDKFVGGTIRVNGFEMIPAWPKQTADEVRAIINMVTNEDLKGVVAFDSAGQGDGAELDRELLSECELRGIGRGRYYAMANDQPVGCYVNGKWVAWVFDMKLYRDRLDAKTQRSK